MKRGVPPTLRNARTGLFTPPGINCFARSKSASEFVVFIGFSLQFFAFLCAFASLREGCGRNQTLRKGTATDLTQRRKGAEKRSVAC